MRWKFGYTRGYEAGYEACKEAYERQLALLTDQLADARTVATAANARADATFDQFMLRAGAQPVSLAAQTERHDIVKATIDRHGIVQENAFEEYEIGDERGVFKTYEAAALENS